MADITNKQLLDSIAHMFADVNGRLDRLERRLDSLEQRFNEMRADFVELQREGRETSRKLEVLRSGIGNATHAAQ